MWTFAWVWTAAASECPDRPGVEAPDGDALVALLGRSEKDPEVAAVKRCWRRQGPKLSHEDHGDLALTWRWDGTLTGIHWRTDDALPFGLREGDDLTTVTTALGLLPPVFSRSEFERTVERGGRAYRIRLGTDAEPPWNLHVDLVEVRAPTGPVTCPGVDLSELLGLSLAQAVERVGVCGELRVEKPWVRPPTPGEWQSGREFSLNVQEGVVRMIEVGPAYGGAPPAGLPPEGDLGVLSRSLPGARVTCVADDEGTAECEVGTSALVVSTHAGSFEGYSGYFLRQGDPAPAPAPAPPRPAPAPTPKPAPVAVAPAPVAPVPAPAPAPTHLPSLEGAVVRTGRRAANDAAVAIGLEDYPFLHSTVPYASRDAQAFTDLATYTLGVPGDRVFLLTQGARGQILDVVRRAGAAAGPGGTVWVFFAGHGAAHPSTGERMVLGDDVRADPVGFADRGVSLSELEREAGAHGATPLLVLDACYSGAGRDGSSFLGGARFAVPAYAKTSGSQWNAASADQFASPLDPVQHGAFSYFAIGALRGWADGVVDGVRDGAVTAAEAQSYVTGMLRRQGLAQQTPVWMGDADRVLSNGTEVGPSF